MKELAIKILALVGVLAAIYFGVQWYGDQRFKAGREQGVEVTTAAYEQKLDKQRIEAGRQLNDALDAKIKAEKTLRDLQTAQQLKDEQNAKRNTDLSRQLATERARNGGRLYDPNATPCVRPGSGSDGAASPATASAGQGGPDAGSTGGLLSVPLSDLLTRVLSEADELNIAYASCRADSFNVRGLPVPSVADSPAVAVP